MGQRGLNDMPFDEGAGSVEAAVQVEGGDDSFEGVGEQRRLSAAACSFFAAAKTKERAEIDASRYFAKMAPADEGGAEPCEFALARVWEAAEESFGDDEAKDGVADELELLVVVGGVGERIRFGFGG
jgi:hypothetical protein